MAIEHADFEGIERLALVLGTCELEPVSVIGLLLCFCLSQGGEIVSTFGSPEKVRLGKCKLIEEVMIGEDKVTTCKLALQLAIIAFKNHMQVPRIRYTLLL